MAQTVFKRYEKKYLMTKAQEEEFLKRIEGYMALDQYGETTICNIYFDTPDFDLIRYSIERPFYKEKLRLRSYGVPKSERSPVFIEIKKKYDGVVYKRRAMLTLAEAEDYLYRGKKPDDDSQILREIDWFLKTNDVKPMVYLAYDRRAYAGFEDPEFRMTLDRNIRCRRTKLNLSEGTAGEKILDDDLTLLEIKVAGAMPLWMVKILSELKIYNVTISKYGTYYQTHKEAYMAVVENHSAGANENGEVVSINRLRKDKLLEQK